MVAPGLIRDAVQRAFADLRKAILTMAEIRAYVLKELPEAKESSIRSSAQKHLKRVKRGSYRLNGGR